jgi:hypothetical protein
VPHDSTVDLLKKFGAPEGKMVVQAGARVE